MYSVVYIVSWRTLWIHVFLFQILNLDDDTVLEKISLTEPDTEFAVDMSPVEQAVVLATM